MIDIRKAEYYDLPDVCRIYDEVHTAEEQGLATIGWDRKIYPVPNTAIQALQRSELFVMEEDNEIIGTAIINKTQLDIYRGARWKYEASDDEVVVLHTLVITPELFHKGYGKYFVRFYEQYAREHNAKYLRIDTNEKNTPARELYAKLGYTEADIAPCEFNGISGVNLVMLEKKL